jgi:hypothetical protein
MLAATATHYFVAIEVYLPENTKKVYIFSSVENTHQRIHYEI